MSCNCCVCVCVFTLCLFCIAFAIFKTKKIQKLQNMKGKQKNKQTNKQTNNSSLGVISSKYPNWHIEQSGNYITNTDKERVLDHFAFTFASLKNDDIIGFAVFCLFFFFFCFFFVFFCY